MMTTTRSNSTGKRGKAPVTSHSEQETPKRSRSMGGGKQVESNTQEVTVKEKEKSKRGKRGGPKKKPAENGCAANGTNDVIDLVEVVVDTNHQQLEQKRSLMTGLKNMLTNNGKIYLRV